MKKGMAVVLSTAMVLGVLPGTGGVVKEVKAAGNATPTFAYFTDVKGLEAFSLANADDTVGKINFGLNGSGVVQQWKIAGVDTGINEGKNNIILFADTPYQTAAFEDDSETNKNYSTDWGCTYTEDMTGK